MFVASVALTYAAWEAYVEDAAVEVSAFLADNIDPGRVPASARSAIESVSSSAWELTVHPGWREIWKSRVVVLAKGDPNGDQFGMNTAGTKQIELLYSAVGVSFLKKTTRDDRKALEELIIARGKVVHSANTPESFNKQAARDYRNLVERLAIDADVTMRDQARNLVGHAPW